MKNKYLALFFLSPLCMAAPAPATNQAINELQIGNESYLYQPTNDDFNRMNKTIEYFEAKKRLINIQTEIRDISLGAQNPKGADKIGAVGNDSTSNIPRALRGRSEGDVFIDEKGNAIKTESKPTAFVSAISGMGGSLSAEVVWGKTTTRVKTGDYIIGGNWSVEVVNKDDIIITDGIKRFRLGSVPVDVASIVGGDKKADENN